MGVGALFLNPCNAIGQRSGDSARPIHRGEFDMAPRDVLPIVKTDRISSIYEKVVERKMIKGINCGGITGEVVTGEVLSQPMLF